MLPNEQAALWYVIHTYSGYENKVAANIQRMVETRGLENLIFETRIPTEILVDSEEEADEYRKGDAYADEDDTAVLVAHHLPVFQFFRTGRHQATIVPIDFYFRHLDISFGRTCGECIRYDLCVRRGVQITQSRAADYAGRIF